MLTRHVTEFSPSMIQSSPGLVQSAVICPRSNQHFFVSKAPSEKSSEFAVASECQTSWTGHKL